jgi:hypothetical protein
VFCYYTLTTCKKHPQTEEANPGSSVFPGIFLFSGNQPPTTHPVENAAHPGKTVSAGSYMLQYLEEKKNIPDSPGHTSKGR